MDNRKVNRILYTDWIPLWMGIRQEQIDKGKGKQSSQGTYAAHLSKRILPTLGDFYVDELTTKCLEEYALTLVDPKIGKPLSKKTTKDIIGIIKSSIRAAKKEGYETVDIGKIEIPQTFQKKTALER